MQLQNEQIKFLLENMQKMLVTVLSNQQSQNKCCCFNTNNHCVKNNDFNSSKLLKSNETQERSQLQNPNDVQTEKLQTNVQNKDEKMLNKNPKCGGKLDNITPVTVENPKKSQTTKCNGCDNSEKDSKKEKERTYSVVRYINFFFMKFSIKL